MTIIQNLGMYLIPFFLYWFQFFLGQRQWVLFKKEKLSKLVMPGWSVVGASLGLLAFILAFMFQIVDNRYNERKSLLLEEVTTIRTTYICRAGLTEPGSRIPRKLLIEYTVYELP